MFKKVLFAVLLLLPAAQLVLAWDAWIEKQDGQLVVQYGRGARHISFDPQKVKDAKGFDSKGSAVQVGIVKHKERVSLVPKGNAAIVTVSFDNGYWVHITDAKRWKNIPKREAAKQSTVLDSSKVQQYAKAILAPYASFAKPLGLYLEIVPEKDPLAMKAGDVLPVKVLLEGKVLEGAKVWLWLSDVAPSDSMTEIKTDKDGNANVVISKPGPQVIAAHYKTTLKGDPDADMLSLATSLAFETK